MFELIHRDIAHGSYVQLVELYASPKGKVRLTIHRDPYDFQSWGKTELWDGSKWNEVYTLQGVLMQTLKNVMYRPDWQTYAYYSADVDSLLTRTAEVLQ